MVFLKTVGFWLVQMVWGAPQFVIGLVAFLILFPFTKHFIYRGAVYTVKTGSWGGLSMGAFIFVDEPYSRSSRYQNFIDHEFAHSIQSLILGGTWLFIIGIPSLLWAGFFHNMANKKRKKGTPFVSYYAFYTEKWAERIKEKYLQ